MADTEAEVEQAQTPPAPTQPDPADAALADAAPEPEDPVLADSTADRTAGRHDRCRPGMNHLAFFAADRKHVDELVAEALLHGWRLMFTDLHPYAGGEHHYAAYLENADGFEIELVAGTR
jgi:catechol 2,3-dioxygenase-like lactoylglutathione lyase family enzyme